MLHLFDSASDNVVIVTCEGEGSQTRKNKKRMFHRVMNDHRRCINSDSMWKMKSEKEVHSILVQHMKKESEETKKTNFIIDDTDTIVMNYIDDIFKGVTGR
ncbi:hypothetical protein D8674_018026 [Pyrus ussuriensis x Pyrus communis]|uniref:Uncharacterized protein n=1 Tax=Pyrus ussuriensis x Pyrus communis TaxID=2448454 RepID=A0A5N5HED0_9ROSA|nr:hypothetical protein D8674_018026 [Pyrus ussuriensis x Pyrus communis]